MLQKNSLFIFSLTLLVFVSGCSQFQTRSQVRKKQVQNSTNPQQDQEQEAPAVDNYVEQSSIPKVGVILGPGTMKSFAHVGVLKKFKEHKIPVDFIIGVEWGALIAGMYAQEGRIHDLEWKLYKLKYSQLFSGGFLSFGDQTKSMSWFDQYFKNNLSSKSVSKTRIPFSCPSHSLKSGKVSWQSRGSLSGALKKCMAFPPLFKPYRTRSAGVFSLDKSIKYLRSKGAELIIVVNVINKARPIKGNKDFKSEIIWNELSRHYATQAGGADVVINVNTQQFSILDWKKRKQIVKAGERAGEVWSQNLIDKYNF